MIAHEINVHISPATSVLTNTFTSPAPYRLNLPKQTQPIKILLYRPLCDGGSAATIEHKHARYHDYSRNSKIGLNIYPQISQQVVQVAIAVFVCIL